MREKFEDYAREFGFSLELCPNEEDNFLEHDTNMIYAAWREAWQTATQQSAAPRPLRINER